MKRGFQASAAPASPRNGSNASHDDDSVVSTASVMEHSPIDSLRTPTDESPMRSPSESSHSSASRAPSSRSSHSNDRSSRSYGDFSAQGSYGPSTVSRYNAWSNGRADPNSRAAMQPDPSTLGLSITKKRLLQDADRASAKRRRTHRMIEQFSQHSSALLHRATLEDETRASDLADVELRRQQQKREKYESKIRSLRRELEALDPVAARAFDREQLGAACSPSDVPVIRGESVQPVDAAVDPLLPPAFAQRDAALRTSLQQQQVLLSSFRSLLTPPSASTSSA